MSEGRKGSVEWKDADGERMQRAITRLVVRWPDGRLSGPVPFDGEIMLGDESDDMAWLFMPLKKSGQLERIGGVLLWALVGAAVYKNWTYFWG